MASGSPSASLSVFLILFPSAKVRAWRTAATAASDLRGRYARKSGAITESKVGGVTNVEMAVLPVQWPLVRLILILAAIGRA